MTVTIRRATLEDADQIAGLLCQLGYASTAQEVEKRFTLWFDDPFSAVLVAEHSGRAAGCLSLHAIPYLEKTGRWARIESLVVDEAARRTGAGSQLISAAEELARQWHCSAVEVTTLRSRLDANAFYKHHGYDDRCTLSARYWKDLSG
ncbi:GNAT family N-acetyltransferase [Streptomyces sp. NPDC053474]|uniref:GNAT family N-acetyltransferase n=1 Tax=Streptomyces sp. NPDC053474 TaxID=3365704 RepID=UPI0037D27788